MSLTIIPSQLFKSGYISNCITACDRDSHRPCYSWQRRLLYRCINAEILVAMVIKLIASALVLER